MCHIISTRLTTRESVETFSESTKFHASSFFHGVAVVAVAVVAVTSHIAVGEGPEKPYCRLLIHFDMDQF